MIFYLCYFLILWLQSNFSLVSYNNGIGLDALVIIATIYNDSLFSYALEYTP